jgi:hypothetical protein
MTQVEMQLWETGTGNNEANIRWIKHARSLRLTMKPSQAGVAFLSSSWSEALLPP